MREEEEDDSGVTRCVCDEAGLHFRLEFPFMISLISIAQRLKPRTWVLWSNASNAMSGNTEIVWVLKEKKTAQRNIIAKNVDRIFIQRSLSTCFTCRMATAPPPCSRHFSSSSTHLRYSWIVYALLGTSNAVQRPRRGVTRRKQKACRVHEPLDPSHLMDVVYHRISLPKDAAP